MNARYYQIDGNRKRTPTGEYLSPWSAKEGWSFNPQNISVFSAPTSSGAHDSIDRSLRGSTRRHKMSFVQKMTIGLLLFSLCVFGMIIAMLFS